MNPTASAAPPFGVNEALHELPVTVYVEDTDLSGVVYHANYLRYMERGRSEMLTAVGIDQHAAFADGTGVYAVASLAIRYRAPARLGDRLVVETRLTGYGAASAHVHQRVRRGPDMLAQADVVAAFLDPTGQPKRQPGAWIEIFARLISRSQ